MEFKDELKKYTERLENIKDTLQTEEATKMSLIVPFFSFLDMMCLILQNFVQNTQLILELKKEKRLIMPS